MAELTTERLILRPVVRDDLPRVRALAGDAEVAESTFLIPHPFTAADVEAWFAACGRDNRRVFAIEQAADHTLLGAIAVTMGEDGKTARLDYWLGREHWGKGFATEAVRRLLVFAFGQLKLTAVEGAVLPGNTRAIRVFEKTGFRSDGPGKHPAPGRGKDECDVELFTATRASFAQMALSQAVGRQ